MRIGGGCVVYLPLFYIFSGCLRNPGGVSDGDCEIVSVGKTLDVEEGRIVFHNRLRFLKPLKNKGKINFKKF